MEYKTRVEIFTSESAYKLEKDINLYLKNTEHKIVDIKYSTVAVTLHIMSYSAMIICETRNKNGL